MSKGDSNNTLLTYSSYLGAVLEGDQTSLVMNNPGIEYHIATIKQASLTRKVTNQKLH